MDSTELKRINNININSQNTITAAVPKKPQPEAKEEKKNENNLPLALTGLAIAGAAAIGIGSHLKGKTNSQPLDDKTAAHLSETLNEAARSIQIGVKKFFNSSNESIENVSLKKGRAFLKDNTPFSGTMLTKTSQGVVSIEYQDGFMTKSAVDGKLKKVYEKFESMPSSLGTRAKVLNRSEGTLIKEFKDDEIIGTYKHLYGKDGRITRKITEKGKITEAVDYIDGKISATSIIDGSGIKSANILDTDGNIVKSISRGANSQYEITEFGENGKKVTRTLLDEHDRILTLARDLSGKPQEINYYDNKGIIRETFVLEDNGNLKESVWRTVQDETGDTISDVSIGIPRQISEGFPARFYISIKNKPDFLVAIGENDKITTRRGLKRAELSSEEKLEIKKIILETLEKCKQEGIDTGLYKEIENYINKF